MDVLQNPEVLQDMDLPTALLILNIALQEAQLQRDESAIRRLEAIVRTASRSKGIYNAKGEFSSTGAQRERHESTRQGRAESSTARWQQRKQDSNRQENRQSSAITSERGRHDNIYQRNGESSATSSRREIYDNTRPRNREPSVTSSRREIHDNNCPRNRFSSVAGAQRERQNKVHRASGAEKEDSKSANTVECIACYEKFGRHEMAKMKCSHYWCKECFERRFSLCNDRSMYPPTCCNVEMPVQPGFQDKANINKYEENKVEWDTKHPVYCSYPKCAKFIAPQGQTTTGLNLRCPHCSNKTCKRCKKAGHSETVKCKESGDVALQAAIKLMAENHWQRCPRCHAGIERTAGCNKMT